jgi:hypothetical protein
LLQEDIFSAVSTLEAMVNASPPNSNVD